LIELAAGAESSAPDYVVIGHVTRDVVAGGYVVGGTVTYAGLTAAALGRRVGVVTSASSELDLNVALPGLASRVKPAAATTTFENRYHDGRRTQWVRAIAASLEPELIPPVWRYSPIVHLAPLVDELNSDILKVLSHVQLLGVTPQGWLRRWDANGIVSSRPWDEAELILPRVGATILSEEDVGRNWEILRRYARLTPILAVTQGANGCTVFENGKGWHVPAFPVVEVDATGAGDVFAAAFLIRLLEDGNPVAAARYANCVASFAVEAIGVTGIPSSQQVRERLNDHRPVIAAE